MAEPRSWASPMMILALSAALFLAHAPLPHPQDPTPAARAPLNPAHGTAEWSRFRGPNGTGLAAAGSYPAELGPEMNVRWKVPIAPGHSSPVLSAQAVFLTTLDTGRLHTYAIDRASGDVLWRAETPRPRQTVFHGKNHSASASPAVDGDTVAVFFDEYGLMAFDHGGKERFRMPLGPFDNVYGMGASPILVDDVIVLACDQSSDSYVIGVSKEGEELWRVPRPRAISGHCTPVVHRTDSGAAQVVLPGSYLLDAYDLLTGERAWWVRGLPSEMKSVPVLLDGTLWIHGYSAPINDLGKQIELPAWGVALKRLDAGGDGSIAPQELEHEILRNWFTFYDLDQSGELNEREWAALRDNLAAVNAAMAIRVGGEGDVTGSAVLWKQHRSIPQLPSPLVAGGVYYMLADQGGLVTALDPSTGERVAKERLSQGVDSYYASPVATAEHVYLLSEAGILSVLPAGSLEPSHTADFGESCYATPALEDGAIWLRTETALYCFAEQD